MKTSLFPLLILLALCVSCASGDLEEGPVREPQEFVALLNQTDVLPSSVLSFEILNSSRRESSEARVRLGGILDGGERFEATYFVPVDRVGSAGNLKVSLDVNEGLFTEISEGEDRRFTGSIEIELDDPIGLFGIAYVEDIRLDFRNDATPKNVELPSNLSGFPDQEVVIRGDGFLRPEEGTTYALVTQGRMIYPDASSRVIANARVALEWNGTREEAILRLSPALFGVRVGQFEGELAFESVLRTGQKFSGTLIPDTRIAIDRSRIESLEPRSASRGQKVTIRGRGFVVPNDALGYGMYLTYDGTFTPSNPNIPPLFYSGNSAIIRVPFEVSDESTILQDVWYEISQNNQITGLGATPGVFEGTITPTLFDASSEQVGQSWRGSFEVTSTKQIIFLKYLPGFTRALQNYGLVNVEHAVKEAIIEGVRKDYEDVHVEVRDTVPQDFIEFTTVEIGGPDPSGLLNFGYDNSFNQGGKDTGNLFLGDYLGGVNRHSQDAGFLPYGGVFIESFVIFSPTLFPDNFGTSPEFDRVMSKVMPSLGGQPADPDDLSGDRAEEVEAAVSLIANLTSHTAVHEVGHALGLAHFPPSVQGHEKKFHNDPPGEGWIMNSGADRPFDVRAQLPGAPTSRFSPRNMDYLMSILGRPE